MSDSLWGNGETEFFYQLTPHMILDAVEKLGLQATGRVSQLGSMENRVYELELETSFEGQSSNFLVAKFYRPGRWSQQQLLDEHQFMHELEEAEVPVVASLKLDGVSLFEWEASHYFCLYPQKGGRSPQEMSTQQLETLGRQIARMHIVGNRHIKCSSRLKLDCEHFLKKNLDYLIDHQEIPAHLEKSYAELIAELEKVTKPLIEQTFSQRIHGDCHWGNIIDRAEEGMFFIDFDDSLIGPCVQDLWLINPQETGTRSRAFDVLLEAYESMKHFDDRELQLIEPLRALRFVHFSTWIAKRWKDPAFQRAFPQFGERDYWSSQIHDLEQQLQLIKKGF